MDRRKLSVRKTREVLRLSPACGFAKRQIARSLEISHSTVCDMVYRANAAGLDWPGIEAMDDTALDSRLYVVAAGRPKARPEPDFEMLHSELRRKGVTLQLLWYEYRQAHSDGYQYSQFCERYRRWQQKLDVVMRQTYRAGEKMFVDYAGQTMRWIDRDTGEVHEAQIFIAVLGAGNYTYAEAQPSQQMECWIGGHCNAFEYFRGVTEVVVPDNIKTGVNRACRYEPDLNVTYHEMATHYGTVIIPARPRKPTDKAKVEEGVLNAERQLMAPLRNHKFFSLEEVNGALQQQLERLNARPFQKLQGSRLSAYEMLDRPALKALPQTRYEIAEWRSAKVNVDYHVEVAHNFYSVPYQLVREQVDVRLTGRVVEVLFKNKRVASHKRSYGRGVYTTDPAHMPASHAKHLEWTPSRLLNWAATVGPNCANVAERILESKPHPEQGYRACLGLMRLSKSYGNERMDAACARVLAIKAPSYKSVNSILKTGLDRVAPQIVTPMEPVASHAHLRGPKYYQEELSTNAAPTHTAETTPDEA